MNRATNYTFICHIFRIQTPVSISFFPVEQKKLDVYYEDLNKTNRFEGVKEMKKI